MFTNLVALMGGNPRGLEPYFSVQTNGSPQPTSTESPIGFRVYKERTGKSRTQHAGGRRVPLQYLRQYLLNIYSFPTKVPYHHFNYLTATAIFIRVVSRYGKVTMRYWKKPLTAPPGGR
ncbi:hypothetical protein AVEN_10906-1 [Araneus ventricosus]|uniref:Uncharacterized protein n=1 Tax=Araneus ventricosus TaxID=182803 RepID=A0A4Y2SRK0_ARAVE|nr:hypothetical protein AVEN_10906-1 [Araneus ventricosus]